MKDSHWKALSLVATSALILVVASWATAQDGSQPPSRDVIVEADKHRYRISIGHASAKEVDKYILYDSWDVANTKDVWFLKDPHNPRSEWKRIDLQWDRRNESIASFANGDVWIAGERSIHYYSGALDVNSPRKLPVRLSRTRLCADPRGFLWVANYHGKLLRLDQTHTG